MMTSRTSRVLSRMCACWTYELSVCCCGCSLRFGVLSMAVLLLVNASLAFAGEAALYSGLLTSIAAQAEGRYLPPGTHISDYNSAIHGGLITVGVYTLVESIAGFVAATRRSTCAATLLTVQVRRGMGRLSGGAAHT